MHGPRRLATPVSARIDGFTARHGYEGSPLTGAQPTLEGASGSITRCPTYPLMQSKSKRVANENVRKRLELLENKFQEL